jgi:hypothetical protein
MCKSLGPIPMPPLKSTHDGELVSKRRDCVDKSSWQGGVLNTNVAMNRLCRHIRTKVRWTHSKRFREHVKTGHYPAHIVIGSCFVQNVNVLDLAHAPPGSITDSSNTWSHCSSRAAVLCCTLANRVHSNIRSIKRRSIEVQSMLSHCQFEVLAEAFIRCFRKEHALICSICATTTWGIVARYFAVAKTAQRCGTFGFEDTCLFS